MALQVNGLNIVQNNPKPQMNMTFKANSVATTNTLERTPTTDTLQTKSKKKGLSTGAKLGLGALALAGIGTVAYLATRGKVSAKQAQQFAEHIEFKPAKTVEEAKKFAQEKLGVHYYEIDDVNMINYLNEWVTETYNKAKGKITNKTYPKIFANSHCKDGYDSTFAFYEGLIKDKNIEGYMFSVNTDAFNNFDKCLNAIFETNHKHIKLDIFGPKKDYPFVKDFFNRVKNFNNSTASFDDKIKILQDIYRIREGQIIGGQFIPANISKHRDLWHELGHLQHSLSSSNYNQMDKAEEYIRKGLPVPEITKEFSDNKTIQETANKVSWYACTSPAEFVAETFAGLLEGKTYSDDVMALYKKYGGPALS